MSKPKLSHQLEPSAASNWRSDILKSIAIGGTAEASITAIIGDKSNQNAILDLSNGRPRLTRTVTNRAELILSQPLALSGFAPPEIRCVLCAQAIRYPAWYYVIGYAVNQFHYFVCFDSSKPEKPTTKCYRKG